MLQNCAKMDFAAKNTFFKETCLLSVTATKEPSQLRVKDNHDDITNHGKNAEINHKIYD